MKFVHQIFGTLIILMLAMATASGQPGWSVQTSGTSENLYSVSFPADNIGSAVGNNGAILRTMNGGLNWNAQNATVTTYRAVSFSDPNMGTASGYGGTIVYTSNGGTQWIEAQSGWMLDYFAAHQLNSQTAMVAGVNTIFQPFVTITNNGWQSMQNYAFYVNYGSVGYEGTIRDVHFLSQNVGLAAVRIWDGHGAIVRTENQGQTWTTVAWADHALLSLDFPSATTGYAVGEIGQGLKTTNGGQSWSVMATGTFADLNGVSFTSADEGWAVGDGGLILHTTDGGSNWSIQSSGVNVDLNAVDFVSAADGYAVGNNGTILHYGELQTPDLTIALTPINPPIIIPAGGGSFQFDVTIANLNTVPIAFQAWIMVQLPSGSFYGPVLGPLSLTLPTSASISRLRDQTVPGGAPAGNYSYIGYAGIYPSMVVDSSSFDFSKSGTGDANRGIKAWANSGEEFPENEPQTVSAQPPENLLVSVTPNPFNPDAVIRFELPQASSVSLRIYDTLGRFMATLASGWQAAGIREFRFDGSDLRSGVYIYRLQAGEWSSCGKLMLMK